MTLGRLYWDDASGEIMGTEELTADEYELVKKVVWQLEMSTTGRCLECGRGRMFHLINPLRCIAVVGILRARLGI